MGIVLTPRVVKDDWAKITTKIGTAVMRLEDWQCRKEEEEKYSNGKIHKEISLVSWLRQIGYNNVISEETLEEQKYGVKVEFNDFKKNHIDWVLFSSEEEARSFVEEVYLICSYCGTFKYTAEDVKCTRCKMPFLFEGE